MTQSPQSVPLSRPVDNDEIDLLALMGTIWRGKMWIALATVIGLALGVWYAYFKAVPVYTASTTVALDSRQDQVMDIQSVVTGLSGDQASINTELEVYRSRRLIAQLVTDLDLTADPEFNPALRPEKKFSLAAVRQALTGPAPVAARSDQQVLDKAIDLVLSKLSVSNVRQSYVFRITVTTESPEKSARIANRLAELYVADQIQVKLERTREATRWLAERVTELQVALEQAEEELKAYAARTDLVSPEGLVALNRQLKELRERRASQATELTGDQDRLAAFEAIPASDRRARADLAGDSTLTSALARIETGETGAATVFDTRLEELLTRLRDGIDRKTRQIAALDSSITEVEARIVTQSEELVQLQQLQRESEASRLIYEAFLGRLKETSIQQGIQQADSRILSEAVVPSDPSAPRKPMILALSMILGLIAGTGAVLLREMSQNTFRVAEDLEARTGYAVLGQIPVIPARSRDAVLKYLSDKPNSAAAEAIRNLRTSLLLANLDKAPQVILSTSSVPGEGKTTQSIALAQNFAGLGEKVLLVEGDIRRRVFRDYFDINTRKGFLSVLSGNADLDEVLVAEPRLGADILIGEKSSVNAADLYSSERFARFIADLRGRYDRIIIDTPPVLAVPDARIIGQLVDAILYTVRWDSTTHRQVADGLKSFETANLRPSGLVLGQIDKRGMRRYGYGDSYGAYQAYYDN